MLKEGKQTELLEKAEAEEKAYNWGKAAKLYKRIAESFLDKKRMEEAAEIYYKIGFAYYRMADTVETAEEYTEAINNSIKTLEEAISLYTETNDKAKELECKAFALGISSSIMSSLSKAKSILKRAHEFFIQASELYFKRDDQESYVRTLNRALFFLMMYILLCSDPKEIDVYYEKGINLGFKTWNLSKDIENIQYIAGGLFYEALLHANSFLHKIISHYTQEEHCRQLLLRCEESLRLIEGCDDPRILGMINTSVGIINFDFGFYFTEDELQQNNYIDKGIKYMEKGVEYFKKTKDKSHMIGSLFFLIFYAGGAGKINYLQKRIINDLNDLLEIGEIYRNSTFPFHFLSIYLPAYYYANFAQWSFFTPTQRKSYAEKAIGYAQEAIKNLVFPPYFSFLYLALTMSHSVLIYLSTDKDKKEEHLKKMLQYAQQTNEIGEIFPGGIPRSFGYNALTRAYKTLADNTESEEERIKSLTIAADASKKFIKYALGRTGYFSAQMRLGLLYEEIGIISMNEDTLLTAKDLFLQLIEQCHERGYQSYAAAAYEYIARLEDRFGNHNSSAQYYGNAQNAYAETLKNIEYRLLKKRVDEKILYVRAWNLIEKAKAYHKRENHIKAIECYGKASEILNNVSRYNYEAAYYAAWSLLEEAEEISKQNRQEDAIERYRTTRIAFEKSIETLANTLKKTKEKLAGEKIEKLKKVARLRMNYCSARIDLETARILGKQGEHLGAAEKFASAAFQFRNVCTSFKSERERKELEAVYYLCRAWESMELAEKYEDPERFIKAANLFDTASKLFTHNTMKFLALGNASFCQALEHGCEFDETIEIKNKANLYPKIKIMLRKAAESYQKGGFTSGSDWALATSTYFDAAWALIRADEELDFKQKNELLRVGSEYLRSTAELFAKSGNIHKNQEVLERLEMVEKEKKIIFSALNSIEKPSITSSTIGIVAPACPLESSQSPRLGEVYQINEEERRVIQEKALRGKYEIIYRDLLKEYPRVQKRECRVGVAQIGVSKSGNIINEFYEMKVSGLLRIREDKIEMVRTKVKTMIESAAENGVNILIFPEMTIDLNYSEFIKDISDLAKLYNMYIVPGSYHDQETKRNLSMVIGPDGILWQQEKHIPATIHLGGKMFKEAIEIGTYPRKTIVCNTEYGRIAIAICRDFLDMDLRVELKNFEPPVDIILNPAFTPVTADFKAAHFDARRSIYAYCFFANIGEFGDSLIYTPEKERTERTIPSKEEGLIYKDMDLFKLRSERKKWEKEQKKERLFIQSTR